MMQRFLLIAFVGTVFALAGCKSSGTKPPSVAPPPEAVLPRELQELARQPHVTVLGEVRNPVIPWDEELTLAQALIAADYVGRYEPFNLIIRRQGKQIHIVPRRLLSGTQNPLLDPGDIIEIRR